MNFLILVITLSFLTQTTFCTEKMIVSVPLVDLMMRYDTVNKLSQYPILSGRVLHSTQLLFGEKLIMHEKKELFLKVSTPDQMGYVGWIKKTQANQVKTFPAYNSIVQNPWTALYQVEKKPQTITMYIPCGSRLITEKYTANKHFLIVKLSDNKKALIRKENITNFPVTMPQDHASCKKLREKIIKNAYKFLNTPYCYSGRSAYNAYNTQEQLTGLDCSGLVNISFLAAGIIIPRPSYGQYAHSRRITRKLEPADLIFRAAASQKNKIAHVMMYLGNGNIIESTGQKPGKVHIVSVEEKIGVPIKKLHHGDIVGRYAYYLGSFFPDV